jgi:ribonuclease P/MRP protein subunit POP5
MIQNAKLKSLMPCLREKKRYLAFEIIGQETFTNIQYINRAIYNGIFDFLGRLDSAKAGVIIISNKYDLKKQRGLIRINHKYVNLVKSALIFISKINGKRAIIKTLGVSGILKKADSKYLIA